MFYEDHIHLSDTGILTLAQYYAKILSHVREELYIKKNRGQAPKTEVTRKPNDGYNYYGERERKELIVVPKREPPTYADTEKKDVHTPKPKRRNTGESSATNPQEKPKKGPQPIRRKIRDVDLEVEYVEQKSRQKKEEREERLRRDKKGEREGHKTRRHRRETDVDSDKDSGWSRYKTVLEEKQRKKHQESGWSRFEEAMENKQYWKEKKRRDRDARDRSGRRD